MNIHKLLFPGKYKEIKELKKSKDELIGKLADFSAKRMEELKAKPEPTIADIMRENLGILPMDYANVNIEGDPVHYLDVDSQTRLERINNLNAVFHNEAFRILIEYLINKQSNFTMRRAKSDIDIYLGRFNINGISLVAEELKKAHKIFEEESKPEEKPDVTEVL